MQKNQVLKLLTENKSELQQKFKVKKIALFGSTARDQATVDSDIDILVAFEGAASAKQFFGVQFFLEDLFSHSVDLVSEKALRPEIRKYVEKDLIDV